MLLERRQWQTEFENSLESVFTRLNHIGRFLGGGEVRFREGRDSR